MISNYLFILGTLLISLNSIRIFRLGISDLAYLTATVLAIVETLVIDKRNRFCWFKNRILLPALIIAFGAELSMFRSGNVGVAAFEIIQSLYVITLFISLTWIMVRRGQVDRIVNALIGSGLIAMGIAMFDYLTHSRIGRMIAGTTDRTLATRWAGPFEQPNTLGSFLVAVSALVFVKWLKGDSKNERLLSILTLPVFFFGIYLSGSTAALIGEFVVLGVIFFFSGRKVQRKLVAYIVPGLIVMFLFLLFTGIGEDIFNGVQRNINRTVTITIDTRVEIYRLAVESIGESLVVGVGYDQLPTSGIPDNARLLPGLVHNALLSILYVGGLVSLLGWGMVYLYIALIAVKVCFARKNKASFLHLGIAAGVFATFFIMQTQASLYRRDWWLFFGLLLAVFWENRRVEEILYD